MPQIIPAAMAAFTAIKGTVAALGAVKVLGMTVATWGKVAMWGAMGASLLMKPPGLPSAVHQITLQPAGTDSALPLIFGVTDTTGYIVYRDAYRDNVHNTNKANNLGFETVVSCGPVQGISNYKITGNQIYFDRDPLRRGSATGLSMCIGVQNFDRGSRVFKDGVRVAYSLGEHTDTRNFIQITGDAYAPDISAHHTMQGLARVQHVYQLDGSKNLRFPMGFPDRPTVTVQGLLCYDPRKDSTYPGGSGPQRWNDQSTWAFSENPYICALTYIIGAKGTTGQKMWGIGADINDIDLPAFVYGANIADNNQWKIGGQVMTDDGKDAILSNMLVCGGGQLLHTTRISCYVNAPKTSIFTIRQHMLVGDQVIRATRPLNQRNNRLVVKYREPAEEYNIVAGTAITADEWVEADGGTFSTETTFPLIQNGKQAHQIGAYELLNSREYEVDITTTTETFHLEVGDAIDLDFPIGAIEGQQFIIKAWQFNPDTHTIDLTLVSETAGKHPFALGQTAVAPAPSRPKSFDSLNPLAPSGWVIEANQIKSADLPAVDEIPADPANGIPETIPAQPAIQGQAIPAFVISRPDGAGDAIRTIIVEARLYDEERPIDPEGDGEPVDSDWVIFGEFEGSAERLVIQNIEAKTTYDLSISYRSNLGVVSPRQRILNVTSGSSSFDWNDDVISNLPPVLGDMVGGKIKAEFIALENEAHETLQDALDDVDTKIGEMNDAITTFENAANDKIDSLEGLTNDMASQITDFENSTNTKVDAAWDIIGRSEADGLRHKVLVLEQQGPDGQLALRVTSLEAKQGTTEADILSLQQAQTTLENGLAAKASASDLTSLKTRVTTAEGDITATNNRVSTVETDVAGKASASEVNTLKNRVTNTETDISAQNTRISSVETDVAGKTNVSDFNSLRTEVTSARNGKTTLALELSSMRQVSNDLTTGKASVTDLNTLKNRVSTTEGDISAHNSRLNTVETDVAGKASASQVNNLESTVNLKNRTYRQTTAPTNPVSGDRWINYANNNEEKMWSGTAGAWLNIGDPRIATADAGVTSLTAKIGNVTGTVVDALAGKASASEVNTLKTRVTTTENDISSQNSRISSVETGLDGKTNVSDFNSLRTEVTSARNGKTTLALELSSMRQVSNDLTTGKANVTDLTNLTNRVSTTEGSISSHNSRLNTIETDVAGKASASSVTSLQATVNTKNRTYRQNAAPTAGLVTGDRWINTTSGKNLEESVWTGSAWTIVTDPRIASADAGVTSINAKIGNVSGTIADALNSKASASSVSTLQTSVNGFDSRITVAQNTAADALGKVNSTYGVILNAQNKITGFQISATQNSSTFDIMADKLRITDGTNTSVPFTYSGGVLSAGSLQLRGSISINNRFIVDANGNITIRSATSGQRTVITSERYEVYDASRLRVRIGIW